MPFDHPDGIGVWLTGLPTRWFSADRYQTVSPGWEERGEAFKQQSKEWIAEAVSQHSVECFLKDQFKAGPADYVARLLKGKLPYVPAPRPEVLVKPLRRCVIALAQQYGKTLP